MYLLDNPSSPSEHRIIDKLKTVKEAIDSLERECIDCCMSCRNFDFQLISGGIFGMHMAICNSKRQWFIHDKHRICCDGRYQMLNEYLPTQGFLKLKLRSQRLIKEMQRIMEVSND